jgi:hypothetical protein
MMTSSTLIRHKSFLSKIIIKFHSHFKLKIEFSSDVIHMIETRIERDRNRVRERENSDKINQCVRSS